MSFPTDQLPTKPRLEELRKEKRVWEHDLELNRIDGLIDLLLVARPRTVLEVGCHRGVSTECFLLHCEYVIAVDSWEGKWAPYYDDFMKRCGHYLHLEIVRGPSILSASRFSNNSVDMVYIDGDHSYDAVVADILAYKNIARKWLAGHDYTHIDSVRMAVNTTLGMPQTFKDSSWLWDKSEFR